MGSRIYTNTTNMYLEIYKDLKQLIRFVNRLKDEKEDRFVEVCNRENNIEMEHYGYAACLYKIRRIEKNIKLVRDSEYISLFEAGYINLHQHRLLNLNTLEGLRLYLDEKLKHVEDLNLYTDEEEMLDFTFDYRVIELIDATKIAVSLEPNVKFNADRHYVVSKKKTLTVCARSLLGVSEVVRKAKELDAMALDALRYYIELLLEEFYDDSETINEVKWMLYELEKSQAYDIQALIENKWNLRASDIAIIISKFIPSLVYGYSGIIKDLHLGHSVDHRMERVMKTMIQDEMIKDK